MILAAAQTKPKRGDISANLLDHYWLIEMASDNGAELIAFPELSITGYERENAHALTFSPNDARIDKLMALAADRKITVIAGAPIKINADLYIGSFVIQPDHPVRMYTKQFLHPGEEVYYTSSFNYNPSVKLGNETISLAICADIDHAEHPANACKVGCSIYIPSIFFSPKGIPAAHEMLSSYAKKYSMNVLMSNYGGDSWGQPSGGRSAFWSKNGELIAAMSNSNAGLLLIEKNNDSWTGKIINDE